MKRFQNGIQNTSKNFRDVFRAGAGHEITTAGNVHAAVEAVGARKFDLILSDLGLPDGTGWDVIREARRQQGITGIALSGYERKKTVAAVLTRVFPRT